MLIDSTDGDATWTTIGVNENIIEASWQALLDSIHFGLLRAETLADRASPALRVHACISVPERTLFVSRGLFGLVFARVGWCP